MTPQEKLIRALTAATPHYPGWSIAEVEKSSAYLAVLEALTDLDKPIPDDDEAWRPFLEAIINGVDRPFDHSDRELISRIRAARHLMPPEERS